MGTSLSILALLIGNFGSKLGGCGYKLDHGQHSGRLDCRTVARIQSSNAVMCAREVSGPCLCEFRALVLVSTSEAHPSIKNAYLLP